MLMLATTSPNLLSVSPLPHNDNEAKSSRSSNGFFFSKPSSRTSLFSSNLDHSCAKFRVSASVAISTNSEVIDKNVKICKYCEMGNLKNAVELVCGSQKSELDLEGYCSVLELCAGLKSLQDGKRCGDLREARRVFDQLSNGKCFSSLGYVREGEWVHGYLYKLGFGSDNTVGNSLMAFYFKNRRIESARKVFDELSDRDVISWNSMISAYVSNGLAGKGVEIFRQMLSFGVDVDLATVINVLMACSDGGNLSLGRALHSYAIKTCLDMDIMFCNNVLDMYSKCGDLSSATQVFGKMGQRSVVSWTSMIAGYVREGLSDEAIELFSEMERNGVSPDVYTITSILHACACNGSLKKGRDIHKYIREHGMDSSLFVCNTLMDMYAKCGSMEDAHSEVTRKTVFPMKLLNSFLRCNGNQNLTA
ncbi:pentatricopeptide repeat-containing protein DOT4 chloroplastic [Prunus yedoensis var. nudiflora]|uniref:Pentatricopeptide repeat-containing protein DOT4 chloroplastic n=1 Tax=Prunus yedoensis var. nudiflora TaxID=2094558 RepID=A0A314UXU5_PRUYE|nr:pentatricopeptide repeat-containing protein DOT4 chloroplastic [Prunus yedoensis var. nudiflora]PQQ21833.1 pentatricopeptide repeat-containing protein DOT4 chloroplastic [Prunus yedoensis var. nudiflora]